jgi:hypothetical protein
MNAASAQIQHVCEGSVDVEPPRTALISAIVDEVRKICGGGEASGTEQM